MKDRILSTLMGFSVTFTMLCFAAFALRIVGSGMATGHGLFSLTTLSSGFFEGAMTLAGVGVTKLLRKSIETPRPAAFALAIALTLAAGPGALCKGNTKRAKSNHTTTSLTVKAKKFASDVGNFFTGADKKSSLSERGHATRSFKKNATPAEKQAPAQKDVAPDYSNRGFGF